MLEQFFCVSGKERFFPTLSLVNMGGNGVEPFYVENGNYSRSVVLHEEDFRFFPHQSNKSPTVSDVSTRTPISSKTQSDVQYGETVDPMEKKKKLRLVLK